MNALPTVAVVILNWNGKPFLEQFLPSVLSSAYKNYKVVVADNASTDKSVPFLKENYPQVELVKLQENYGFAGGYNEALKHVKADLFILLNSDVEVTPSWLEPMVEMMETNPKIAALQPRILSYTDRASFEYAGAAGGWIDLLGYPFAMGRVFDDCEPESGQYLQPQPIFWASGAALMIRAEIFHGVGGFDPFFFAHQEEIDLCWRLQLKGFEIWSCPTSVVYHVGGGTLPKTASRKTFLNFRNNLVMLTKNLTGWEKTWKLPLRLLLDQVAAWKGLLSGQKGYFRMILKAHWAWFRWLFSRKSTYNPKSLPMKRMTGVYKGFLVMDYFIKKKKTFSEIVKR